MRERNMAPFFLHCWKYAVANSTHTVCWSSFSTCGIRFVQTFDFQSCLWESETCCRYAAFHHIHFAYFSWAQHKDSPHISHLLQLQMWHHEEHLLRPPINYKYHSVTSNSLILCRMSVQPFIQEIMTLMVFSQAGNETEQSVNIHIWETSFYLFWVHYSAERERVKKAFSHHSPRSPLLPHSATFHPYIGCLLVWPLAIRS